MDELVLSLLRGSLAANADSRHAAETQLRSLEKTREEYPLTLVNVGGFENLPEADRQAALYALNRYVPRLWSPMQEDYEDDALVLSAETKTLIRDRLLNIIFAPRVSAKIMNATAAAIATIAKSDFPEDWPDLIQRLLSNVEQASDDQADAICTVLKELLRDALDEDQFYNYAESLIAVLKHIATDSNKRLTTRASAVSSFSECFSFVQNLKETQAESMKHFAQNVCSAWTPFLLEVVKGTMPQFPNEEEDQHEDNPVTRTWRGIVALKRAVVMVLMKIQDVFSEIMPAQELFEAVWQAVQSHAGPYHDSFIAGDRQGNMVSSTGVAYTIDLLVIEEIDYMETLLDAPEVRTQLDKMLASDPTALKSWVASVLSILITFSCIPREAEDMWLIDYNIFLTEETFAESSSTPRSMCASFTWKLSNKFPTQTIECVKEALATVIGNSASDWRQKEAVLYNLQQVAEEYDNELRNVDFAVVHDLIRAVDPLLSDEFALLRARAHTAMAAMVGAWFKADGADTELAARLTQTCTRAIDNDSSEVVKVACIRIIPDYLSVLNSAQSTALQAEIVSSIGKFLESQDLEDADAVSELVDTVLQTLRDTVMANPVTCLEIKALDVILTLVKYGAAREGHSSILIDEAFTSAAEAMAKQGPEAYNQFCTQVVPSLIAGLDIRDHMQAQDNVLVDVSVSLIRILAESAKSPLPNGLISATIPRLRRLISTDTDFYLMQSATLTMKEIVDNDSAQVFNWVDPSTQKNGLQICLEVISLLLGEGVTDASAAEVGELANTVVEKAGDALAGSMQDLITVLANRLAKASHLQLIQSLVMVFARLAIKYASDLVAFLDSAPIEGGSENALTLVIRKWLDNSVNFAGFDTIRQNMQALVTIYSLNDVRVDGIEVNGDLIPDNDSRIRTRSQAKLRPLQYTRIPASLKIVKLIVGELVPYSDPTGPLKSPAAVAVPMARRASDDSEWEDEDDDDTPFSQRVADDSTQRFLVEFLQSQATNPRFQELYNAMSPEEKQRGQAAVEQYQAMQAQRIQLGAVPRS